MPVFWEPACDKLSDRLWNPVSLIPVPDERENFKCSHPCIGFEYFIDSGNDPVNVTDPNLQLTDLVFKDNTASKDAERRGKFTKEKKRRKKELIRLKTKGQTIMENFFKIKIPLTCVNLSDSVLEKHYQKHLDILENEEKKLTRKYDKIIKSRRSKLRANHIQRHTLLLWMHICFEIFNSLVREFNQYHQIARNCATELVNEGIIDPEDHAVTIVEILYDNRDFPLNFTKLRNQKIDGLKLKYPNVPHCVIANVIKEFVSNVQGNLTKMEKGRIPDFEMKVRTKMKKSFSMSIDAMYISKSGKSFYSEYMGSEFKAYDENFSWSKIKSEFKIIYEKYNKNFYVHAPKYVWPTKIEGRKPLAVMDPGQRTFQTLYGLDHVIDIGTGTGEWLEKEFKNIKKIDHKLKKGFKRYRYNKKLKKWTRKKKSKYRRARARVCKKIQNFKDELHFKTINYLCKNYDRIMTTWFTFHQVSGPDSNLTTGIKDKLKSLSHGKFGQRLRHRCKEFGCHNPRVGEGFTTKTCGKCGTLNNHVGANEIYQCVNKECGNRLGRDANAARNILIKNREKVLI